MEVFRVFASIGLDRSEFDSGLNAAEQRLQGISQAFSTAGRTLTTRVTLPIVSFGAAALKAGGDFEQAMNQVAAVSGATGAELEAMREQAKELGGTTQFSASQAAEAMGFMAMAGMDASEIIGALPNVLTLAASAQLDMASAADIVTNIMAGFGQTTEQLPGSVDVLVAAFTNANTNLEQLAEAMKYAGPIASAAGVPFEEAAAAIALMGNAGIQGSMAGTSLRGAITRLLNPTETMQNRMRDMGISVTDAQGRLLPLDEIIRQLEPHADDAGFMIELFGQRAGPAMAALVSQGADALTDLTSTLHDSGGLAQEIADVQMEGFNGSLRRLKSAVEALMIAVAESGLMDWLAGMVNRLAGLIQRVSEADPKLFQLGTVIGGLMAAIGPVLWIIGDFAGSIKNLIPLLRLGRSALVAIRAVFVTLGLATGPIGIVIAIALALVAAFTTDFLGIRTAVENQLAAARESFERWGEVISAAMEGAKNIFAGFVDWVTNFWRDIPERFLNFGRDIVTGLRDGIQSMIGSVRETVEGLGERVTGWFKSILGIESPSRVFREYGEAIGQGLANGIDASTPTAVAAVERLGAAVTTAASAIVRGAFTPEAIVNAAVGGLQGADAAQAIRDRLAQLAETRFQFAGRAGTGARVIRDQVDAQIEALNRELRNLQATLRQTAVENQRAAEVQTARFARSVSVFDGGVNRTALAALRY